MNIRLPKTLFVALAGAVGGMAAWVAGEVVLAMVHDPADGTGELPPILYGASGNSEVDLGLLTNAVPAFEPEVQSRLDRENAQTGDLQVSLIWYGQNDLDLHCVDPFGERIWHEHRKAASGGELDVDMNARHPVLQRIALVLDTSGSMRGDRLRETKEAAIGFIRKLDLRSIEVAVISFNSDVKVVAPFTRNRLKLEFGIQMLSAGGSTQMQLGIGKALTEMGYGFDPLWKTAVSDAKNGIITVGRSSRDRKRVKLPSQIALIPPPKKEEGFESRNTIVLFTDGQPSDGSGPLTVRFAETTRSNKIEFLAIGASGAEVEFLRSLTEDPKNVFFARDGQLRSAFSQVASRFKSPFVDDNLDALLRQPKTYNLVIVPYAPVMSANWKSAFNLAAFGFCSRLMQEGHRISITSRNAGAYFSIAPTTNATMVQSAIDSIVWQPVPEPADVVAAAITRMRSAGLEPSNSAGGLLVIGTVERAASITFLRSSSTRGVGRSFRTLKTERLLEPLKKENYPLMFATISKPRRGRTNTTLTVNTHVSIPEAMLRTTNRVARVVGGVTNWLHSSRRVQNPSYRFATYKAAFDWFEIMARYRLGNFDAMDLTRTKTRISGKPVENIFWPTNGAPDGIFEVSVVHFGAYEKERRTPFSVHVRTALKKLEFKGEISPLETNLVFRGHLGPSRDRARRIQDHENQIARNRREHYARMQEQVQAWERQAHPRSGMRLGVMALWTGFVALLLGFVLHVAQQWVTSRALGRWRHLGRSMSLVVGLSVIGALLVHFIASIVPRWSLDVSFLLPELDRLAPLLGWPMLGTVLGVCLAMAIPNLHWWRAGIAGLVTGALAGIGFEFVSRHGTDATARCCGLLLMGVGIGLAIRLLEALVREAALVVHWHANERSVVNLGADPVVIGSGPDVNLYVPPERGVLEIACRIYFVNGQIWLEDAEGGRQTLQPGERFVLGDVGFEIETDVR